MNVLFSTVEMYPLAKVGGLGDVAGSLPKNIKKLGVDIRVAMPYHGTISVDTRKIGAIEIDGHDFEVHETQVGDVSVYLLKNEILSRESVYGHDDYLRWSLFSRAVVHLPGFLGWDVEIIHGNDWMTSLVPLYAKVYGKKFRFLLTVHNLKHQGEVPEEKFPELDLPESMREVVMWNGKINYMKAGIVAADAVNTVSPTYAKEILTEEYSEGLLDVLIENRHKLHGILNGIDYSVWDPERDEMIYANYDADNLEGKKINSERSERWLHNLL